MPPLLPWILAALSLALLAVALGVVLLRRHRLKSQALPTEWALNPRPVFSSTERRLYRLLREALPQQIVLSKLPLVRFCQPVDPGAVRYWYSMLGSSHVSFAICSGSGRVLAVIDVESNKPQPKRTAQIKTQVLAACRVRYLRCTADRLPSIPELQLLVPRAGSRSRAAVSMAPQPGRNERATLWQDSGFMQDSFFGMDGRGDVSANSGFSPSVAGPVSSGFPPSADEIGGVVIDTPVSPLRH
jgi:Protein of unknown function (DUF2726)